jgi:hypothetical protein
MKSNITDTDIKTVREAVRILEGNYTDDYNYIIDMDSFLARKATEAGHVVGTILTVEPERTLVEMPTGEEKWFSISKQELRALSFDLKDNFAAIKDNQISLVW